jgi:RNA polymerase sigma factor (sigma-70 family)
VLGRSAPSIFDEGLKMAAVPSIGRATRIEGNLAPEADATRALYEQYANQVFRYCLHQLGSREEAEDAVQSTFLNAFRGIKRGVVPDLEAAWLFKIAHNVCLSRRRSAWRRGRIESPADFEVIEELAPAPSRRADELIGLQDVLERLPETQRRAILLREWQGLSYREIAEELELSQSAVETLIFRARRSLASGLEQPETKQRRVVRALDWSNVLAAIKTALVGGSAAAKIAATVAVVSATTVVAAAPVQQHQRHQQQQQQPAKSAKAHVVRAGASQSTSAPSVATQIRRSHRVAMVHAHAASVALTAHVIAPPTNGTVAVTSPPVTEQAVPAPAAPEPTPAAAPTPTPDQATPAPTPTDQAQPQLQPQPQPQPENQTQPQREPTASTTPTVQPAPPATQPVFTLDAVQPVQVPAPVTPVTPPAVQPPNGGGNN